MNNKININIDDYISEEQKAEIAEEMFRSALAQQMRNVHDVDRIIGNISYRVVFQEIDAAVEGGGGTLRSKIEDVTYDFLNKGRGYGIFRSKDHWSDASAATKIVEGFIQEKKDLIEERVHQAITQMPFDKIKDEIKYVLHDRINDILAGIDED